MWDLELFLQIQNRLGEHIVLKGGAATQFYLPVEAQRTSVDIDMIFCGTDEQIWDTLNDITKELGERSEFFLFKFLGVLFIGHKMSIIKVMNGFESKNIDVAIIVIM